MSDTRESWIVVRSIQNKENQVDQFLNANGIETYLPVVHRYIVRRKRKELTPFLPGYLFVHVDLYSNEFVTLKWTPGLNSIVRFGDQVARVHDQVISDLRTRLGVLDESGYFDRVSPYRHGEIVRIKSGPFKDLEAIFDRQLSQRGRVRVFLELLGRLTACDINLDSLEKAG